MQPILGILKVCRRKFRAQAHRVRGAPGGSMLALGLLPAVHAGGAETKLGLWGPAGRAPLIPLVPRGPWWPEGLLWRAAVVSAREMGVSGGLGGAGTLQQWEGPHGPVQIPAPPARPPGAHSPGRPWASDRRALRRGFVIQETGCQSLGDKGAEALQVAAVFLLLSPQLHGFEAASQVVPGERTL